MTDRDLPAVLSRAPNVRDKYGVDLWTGTRKKLSLWRTLGANGTERVRAIAAACDSVPSLGITSVEAFDASGDIVLLIGCNDDVIWEAARRHKTYALYNDHTSASSRGRTNLRGQIAQVACPTM